MAISTEPKTLIGTLFGYPVPKNIGQIQTQYTANSCGLQVMWVSENGQKDSMVMKYPITDEKIISVLATMRMTC